MHTQALSGQGSQLGQKEKQVIESLKDHKQVGLSCSSQPKFCCSPERLLSGSHPTSLSFIQHPQQGRGSSALWTHFSIARCSRSGATMEDGGRCSANQDVWGQDEQECLHPGHCHFIPWGNVGCWFEPDPRMSHQGTPPVHEFVHRASSDNTLSFYK